jgi:hypothetical protein
LNSNLQFGGAKVGAVLTRVNSVFLGIFGGNGGCRSAKSERLLFPYKVSICVCTRRVIFSVSRRWTLFGRSAGENGAAAQ